MNNINKFEKDEELAYKAIKQRKNKFGTFHKTCFHIHTPESYDYRLIDDWGPDKYKAATDQDIYEICLEHKVFPDILSIDYFDQIGVNGGYGGRKDFFSFLLLAEELIVKNIEIVMVADHHTIDGVQKLRKAIEYLCKMKTRDTQPKVLLGVEISCGDKNHVVGIFEETPAVKDKLKNWLNESLYNSENIEEGTCEVSRSVLQFISSIGGIGYLAHLDNSNTFKEDKYLSAAYRKKLFSDEYLCCIGLSKSDSLGYIKAKVKQYQVKDVKFVIDNDAHSLGELDKNYFWIKGSGIGFSMIKEALSDYDISISLYEDRHCKQFIKGIYIENDKDGKNGFLSSEDNKEGFCLNFSEALNCIVGGRGTGKSSVLEVLEYVLSQQCESEEMLDFICAHGNTWVLYEYRGDEYLIEMRMPYKEYPDESILRRFGQNAEGRYYYKYRFDKEYVKQFAFKSFLKISKVLSEGDNLQLEAVPNKEEMLKRFFDTRYSINELVNTASGEQINKFLYEVLFKNKTLAKPDNSIRVRKISGLISMLSDVKYVLKKRQETVNEVIAPFNVDQNGILRIVYTQDKIPKEPDLGLWIFNTNYNGESYYQKYNITHESIVDYLLSIYDAIGIFEFLNLVLNKDVVQAKKLSDPINFCTTMNQNLVDKGLCELTIENVDSFLQTVFSELINDNNVNFVTSYLKQYVEDVEEFSLEFNLNSKEGSNQEATDYKNVRKLSLGQKVVAMLSFVLGYSEYSNDYRPLIIDQPEDNLDNRYIYRNLVKQLRMIKEKRQVIIATHNSTIVTNAKADQVCVMNSDNKHGWVRVTGYPAEIKIKNKIIELLEGGRPSFLHKLSVYKDALKIEYNKVEK